MLRFLVREGLVPGCRLRFACAFADGGKRFDRLPPQAHYSVFFARCRDDRDRPVRRGTMAGCLQDGKDVPMGFDALIVIDMQEALVGRRP
ncbi:hypothetical protein, partial [Gordonibacter pamelaeae]